MVKRRKRVEINGFFNKAIGVDGLATAAQYVYGQERSMSSSRSENMNNAG